MAIQDGNGGLERRLEIGAFYGLQHQCQIILLWQCHGILLIVNVMIFKAENWPGILPYRRQAKDWWAWKPASPFIHLAPGILNYSLPTISTAAVILLLLKLLWRADAIPGAIQTHYYTIAVTITRLIGVLRLRWQECSYHRRTMAGAERKEATTESLDICRSRNNPLLTFTFVDFYFAFLYSFGNVNASFEFYLWVWMSCFGGKPSNAGTSD